MGIISVRFNKEEEKILNKLTEHFHADKSSLIKRSLIDLYENIIDLKIIKKHESNEKKGKTSFLSAEQILN